MTLHDLTVLALVNTAFCGLVIPHIYSHFDIAWPESETAVTGHKGIQDLILGLSVVCIKSTFARGVGEGDHQNTPRSSQLSNRNHGQYTKTFCIGNSPEKLVEEYMVYNTGGKMLGIMVANAISRMNNLETFSWDMPTGVLPRVFEALGSLASQPEKTCKLSRVRVRWHASRSYIHGIENWGHFDNKRDLMGFASGGPRHTPIGLMLRPNECHPDPGVPVSYSEYPCGYPTFSVLPPLQSLAVLNIDEIGYLDEMAVLIGRSKDTLQELNVGISSEALKLAFAYPWDGPGLEQIDHQARWPGESTIGTRRLGGVLGLLVGKIYDIPKREIQAQPAINAPVLQPEGTTAFSPTLSKGPKPGSPQYSSRKRLEGKLKLKKLVLERVPLSIHVCIFAFDWSVLTNLTLLKCGKLERLWKMLRKHFCPTQVRTTFSFKSNNKPSVDVRRQYHLALKVIHTDTTSLPLINFIKETLAPNSLEGLFLLHPRRSTDPLLPMETIFRGAIKPHHGSLRKVFLKAHGMDWAMPTKMSLYLTSGRMKNLCELSVTMKYNDWHAFVRRLPNMPQLRVLNFQKMRILPSIRYTEATLLDFANQILNVVSLRPEVGLRYFGIELSCFEILEVPAASFAGGGAGSRAAEGSLDMWASVRDPISRFGSEDLSSDDEFEFGWVEPGPHALFVNAVSSGEEEEEEEDKEADSDDDDDDEEDSDEGEEDDGFVEPGSENARFVLRKVEFCSVQADIIRVMFEQL